MNSVTFAELPFDVQMDIANKLTPETIINDLQNNITEHKFGYVIGGDFKLSYVKITYSDMLDMLLSQIKTMRDEIDALREIRK